MGQDGKRDDSEEGLESLCRWDQICDEFELAWASGSRPDCRDFLGRVSIDERCGLLAYLLPIELERRHMSASPATFEALLRTYPDYPEAVLKAWESHCERESTADQPPPRPSLVVADNPPHPTDEQSDVSLVDTVIGGRYKVLKELGRGGFAIVYLAYDPILFGKVALKIPRPDKQWSTREMEEFAAEARRMVELKGEGIVKIHDLLHCAIQGRMTTCAVQEYFEGDSLRHWMDRQVERIAPETAARLVSRIAEILHFAHTQGVIHRDVKPANILLDQDGQPHLLDFGLALHVSERTHDDQRLAGSIAYMSPEQVRGETHRIEPATDIWSLGVILYEMLTGAKPFANSTRERLFRVIKYVEPALPSRLAPGCPAELERICLKCLAKPIADRYQNALELASDLRRWREADDAVSDAVSDAAPRILVESAAAKLRAADGVGVGVLGVASGGGSMTLVQPKGLAAFEASDAATFVDLLPGQRGRDRLPESIRFWKQRLEEDAGFRVGLLYGPSGCGKSSFFKAGVLPRIDPQVASVFVEATAQDLESRLLAAIRGRFPELPPELSLVAAFEHLREGRWTGDAPNGREALADRESLAESALLADIASLAEGESPPAERSLVADEASLAGANPIASETRRVVVVLDQFEQWLHGNRSEFRGVLSEALRQCDGRRLRVVLLVRDDFWTPLTEFLRVLEERAVDGQNMAELRLFDPTHARKVLATFGAAYGRLPLDLASLDAAQDEFLDAAVAELMENGKVDGVRLSLFAEMMKDAPWTTDQLRELGGLRGLGVLFLEQSLGSDAPPDRRPLAEAAIAVLNALSPPVGGTLKGRRRSAGELAAAADLDRGSAEFGAVMDLLGKRLRLVTPVNDQGPEPAFQLTHDYLVPSLRVWIHRKKLESARGRATLKLEERCAAWLERPEHRQLPSMLEALRIVLLTRFKSWNGDERRMMRRAGRVHLTRATLATLLVSAVVAGGWTAQRYIANREVQSTRSVIRQALASLELCQGEMVQVALEKLNRHPAPLVQAEIDARLNDSVRSTPRMPLLFGQARFGSPPIEELVFMSMTAPGREGANFVRALQPQRERALEVLGGVASLLDQPTQSHPHARLAILALCLGDAKPAERLAKLGPEPAARTSLIAQFGEFNALTGVPARAIEQSTDVDLRSAICLGIGGMKEPPPPEELRMEWAARLAAWHTDSPSGSLHSASGWALGQWKALPEPKSSKDGPQTDRDWFVNSIGQTFVRIPAGTTTPKDAELLEELNDVMKQLRTSGDLSATVVPAEEQFWMSDSEVTAKAFYEFFTDPQVPESDRLTTGKLNDETLENATGPVPMDGITFADAVLFCNWLSLKEGRMPCYSRTGEMIFNTGKNGDRSADLWRFVPEANGYRLPWTAEWIRACRAGTVTQYAFGNHNDRLPDYGVFSGNSNGRPASIRSKRCNGWGLFDMHGNLMEWCNDRTERDKYRYIVQGGCFSSPSDDCGVLAIRKESPRRGATSRSALIGMRLVIRP
jgi:formylglycine-generating enzyme required for sulfatase activity/tRNA A-37 threonylcarbamoyl transferase component Bud32